jgi:hypothetical protein
MPILPAPLRDSLESAPEAVSSGLLLYHPVSLTGLSPVLGEAQQVEGAGSGARIAVVVRRCRNPQARPPEVNQPGLLRVQRQTILRHPLWQHIKHSPCVSFMLEDDDEVSSGGERTGTTDAVQHGLASVAPAADARAGTCISKRPIAPIWHQCAAGSGRELTYNSGHSS